MSAKNSVVRIPFSVLAVMLMSIQDALINFLGSDIGLWQIFVVRGLLMSLMVLGFAQVVGKAGLALRTALRPWVALRSLLYGLMFVLFYASLTFLDLAQVATLFYTSPIFILLLSALLLNERVGARGWLAVLISFVGVVLIFRPSIQGFDLRMLIPIASGFCYALSAIIVRKKCVDEAPLSLISSLTFVMLAIGFVGSLGVSAMGLSIEQKALQPFLLNGWTQVDRSSLVLIGSLAVMMLGSTYFLVKAYQLSLPSVVAPFDYCYLLFAVLWGLLIFGQLPDSTTLGGMALVIMGGLLALTRQQQQAPAPNPVSAVPLALAPR